MIDTFESLTVKKNDLVLSIKYLRARIQSQSSNSNDLEDADELDQFMSKIQDEIALESQLVYTRELEELEKALVSLMIEIASY